MLTTAAAESSLQPQMRGSTGPLPSAPQGGASFNEVWREFDISTPRAGDATHPRSASQRTGAGDDRRADGGETAGAQVGEAAPPAAPRAAAPRADPEPVIAPPADSMDPATLPLSVADQRGGDDKRAAAMPPTGGTSIIATMSPAQAVPGVDVTPTAASADVLPGPAGGRRAPGKGSINGGVNATGSSVPMLESELPISAGAAERGTTRQDLNQGSPTVSTMSVKPDPAAPAGSAPGAPGLAAAIAGSQMADTGNHLASRQRGPGRLPDAGSSDTSDVGTHRTTAEHGSGPVSSATPRTATPPGFEVLSQTAPWADSLAPRILQLATRHGGRMLVELHPAELGNLEIHVELDREDLRVTVNVQHPAARDLAAQHILRLRELLGGQGFANVAVDVEQRDASEDKPDPRQGRGSGSLAPADDVPSAPTRTSPVASTSLIDAYA